MREYQPTKYMSDNIQSADRVFALASNPTWHNKEKPLETLNRENCAAAIGDIVREPLCIFSGRNKSNQKVYTPVEINGKTMDVIVENWQDDDGSLHQTMIKTAADTHQVMGMNELWDILDQAFADCPFEVSCVGTHGNRQNAWISARMIDHDQFIAGSDNFGEYINILDSRAGLSMLHLVMSAVRTVCANTFGFNVNIAETIFKKAGLADVAAALVKTEAGFAAKAKHTKNFRANVDAIKAQIPLILGASEPFIKVYGAMQAEAVTAEKLRKITLGFFARETEVNLAKGNVLSTRAINAANAVEEMAITGKGNMRESGRVTPTLADLWNGFTQYYTSGNGSGNPENVDPVKKLINSEFATGARIKQDSFLALSDESEIDTLAAMGQKMLDNAIKQKLDMATAG